MRSWGLRLRIVPFWLYSLAMLARVGLETSFYHLKTHWVGLPGVPNQGVGSPESRERMEGMKNIILCRHLTIYCDLWRRLSFVLVGSECPKVHEYLCPGLRLVLCHCLVAMRSQMRGRCNTREDCKSRKSQLHLRHLRCGTKPQH